MEICKSKVKSKITSHIKKYYYGLSILKVFLAFDVINCHCFKIKSTSNKFILYLLNSKKLHVPSFIIMSFYFSHSILVSLDSNKIYLRLERIIIPYLGWPLISFIISNFINAFSKAIPLISLKNLLYQIILGDAPKIPLHFWFLFDLIVTTIIFEIIIITFKNHYIFILLILMIFSYYLQYSKINLLFFNSIKQASLGKENEFIPFAVTGFILCELNIIDNNHKNKVKTFIIFFIIYKFMQNYEIFANFEGVQFNGIKLNICSACIIFIYSIFSTRREHKYIKLIKILTNFTGGIYYIHRIVQRYFIFIFDDIKKGTFFGIILIYLFCYAICFLGTLIVRKTKAKYLFC